MATVPLLAVTADAAKVVAHRRKTWRILLVQCCIANALPLVVIGVLEYVDFVLRVSAVDSAGSKPPDLGAVDLTISGSTASAAFAVLGGVIIALQVAARPGSSIVDGDLDQIVARVTVLESLATFSGFAAGALGVLTAWHVGLDQVTVRPVYVVGPLLLGGLLCVLAGDAGTASTAKYGRAIADEVGRQARIRARAMLASMPTHARVSGASDVVLQLLAVVVVTAGFAWASVLAAPSGGTPWNVLAAVALSTLSGTVSTSFLWTRAEWLFRTRQWAEGTAMSALALLSALLFATLSLQVMLSRLDGHDVRPVAWALVVSLFQVLAFTLIAAAVARADFARFRGRGRRFVLESLVRAGARPETGPRTAPHRISAGLVISVVFVAAAGLVPPLGIPIALRCRRGDARPALRHAAMVSLGISALVCAALLVTAAFSRQIMAALM